VVCCLGGEFVATVLEREVWLLRSRAVMKEAMLLVSLTLVAVAVAAMLEAEVGWRRIGEHSERNSCRLAMASRMRDSEEASIGALS
jgi:hypothetical protein